jgi:hypothetical protein
MHDCEFAPTFDVAKAPAMLVSSISQALPVDDLARKRWIACHIFPLEPQARRWL